MKRQTFEKTIPTREYVKDYVNIEKFLTYCKECPNYEKVWSCPSYGFDPLTIWEKYENLYLYAVKFTLEDAQNPEEANRILRRVKDEISIVLFEKEKLLDSMALCAGRCTKCARCAREDNEPCKFPEEMRYSIESLGGDVGRTLSKLMGIDLLWQEEEKLPEYYVLVGGLLY